MRRDHFRPCPLLRLHLAWPNALSAGWRQGRFSKHDPLQWLVSFLRPFKYQPKRGPPFAKFHSNLFRFATRCPSTTASSLYANRRRKQSKSRTSKRRVCDGPPNRSSVWRTVCSAARIREARRVRSSACMAPSPGCIAKRSSSEAVK